MASRYQLKVTVSSAENLKNVNWHHGPTRPYAVLWVDGSNKFSTMVDDQGDTSPVWDEALTIPLPPGVIEDQTLYIDVVHAGSEEDTKPLIGSARVRLRDILDEAAPGVPLRHSLQLKRPTGRPQGQIEVEVRVRETYFRAPPYGVPPATREYAPLAYGMPYTPLLQYGYGGEPPAAAYRQHRQEEEEESNFEGMWTALAVAVGVGVGVGAVAVAGLALAAWLDSSDDESVDESA